MLRGAGGRVVTDPITTLFNTHNTGDKPMSEVYAAVLAGCGPEDKAEAGLLLVTALLDESRYEDALSAVLAECGPEDKAEAGLLLATALLEESRCQDALSAAEVALEACSDPRRRAWLQCRAGQACCRLGDRAAALKWFRDADTVTMLSQAIFAAVRAPVRNHPWLVILHTTLGDVHATSENHTAAKMAYKSANKFKFQMQRIEYMMRCA